MRRKRSKTAAAKAFAIAICAVAVVTTVSACSRQAGVERTENDAEYIAKTLWGECRGCSTTEQAAVAWCILNRVDAAFGDSVERVVTFPNQFLGYDEDNPVADEQYEIALDVLARWEREKQGETDVGRVLPPDYLWFHGDGQHNYFRNKYQGGARWDWSLPSPYAEEDMPIPDNYDAWEAHEAEQQAWLDRCPVCVKCKEAIQDEELFDVNGDLYCMDCAKKEFQRSTEDYM